MGLKAISLFTGAGGMDVGFERVGFETILASELDHDAAETWRINHPGKEGRMIEGDINDHFEDLIRFRESVDLLHAGPPCQGFSVAGKMDPQDPRSQLVFTFLDAVEIVKPKVFVMENVAALGRLEKWSDVRNAFLKRAGELGYDVDYKVWHTPDFGVPQNRDRVIFIGVRDGEAKLFADAMKPHRSEAPTARAVLCSVGQYGTEENPQTCTANVTLAKAPVMRVSPYAGMLVNGAGRPINLDGLPPTLPATMGGNKTPIVDQAALEDSGKANWFEGYHSDLLAGAIDPASAKVPEYMRRLTIKEAAAIQTFPGGYVFSGKKTKQYKQIGNAVPCLFAEAVAKAVKDCYFIVR